MTTNVLRSLDRTSSETLSQTAIQHILDAPQMTDNSVSFFVTTAYSLKSLAICYPSCRIMTVLTLLKLLKSDYDLFYVSECLQELANALNFGSREDLLNELLHQKLLERWGREIKQIPFVLFGHTNFDEFCAKNAHIIVPMYIAQERYDHVQEIASLTGVTVPVLIQKFFPFIVTAILSTLSEGKRMVRCL